MQQVRKVNALTRISTIRANLNTGWLRWFASAHAQQREQTQAGLWLVPLLIMTLTNTARAGAGGAAGDALEPITDFMCGIFTTVTGALGIAISVVVLGVGLLLWALGARGALSRVGQAVVAIAGLVSLPSLFTALFPDAAGTVCGL